MEKNILELARKIYYKLEGPKMWGLRPEPNYGWTRPLVIEYEGQYYDINPDKIIDEPMDGDSYEIYNKYIMDSVVKDIENGVYLPSGVFIKDLM